VRQIRTLHEALTVKPLVTEPLPNLIPAAGRNHTCV